MSQTLAAPAQEARAEVCPKKVAGTARQILKLKDALWTFVYVEGVEPTNNLAESARSTIARTPAPSLLPGAESRLTLAAA